MKPYVKRIIAIILLIATIAMYVGSFVFAR